MADPFSAAGFAPQTATQPQADPFAGAGFVAAQQPAEATAAPPAMPQPIGTTEFGAPIFADDKANAAVNEPQGRLGEKMLQGATFGMFPYIAAGAKWLTGTPFQQGLKEARDYSAQTSKMYPGSSMLAEGVGSLLPTTGAMTAAKPALAAVGQIPKIGSALGQALLGGTLGAASTAGHDIGSGQTENIGADTGKGAAVGAALGGAAPVIGTALQTAPNMVRGGVAAVRNVFTGPGKDAVAGQILREASGDFANGAATSPLPGLELRTSQATGNPGIAGLERTLASEPGTQARLPGDIVQNGRTSNQTSELSRALVGSNAGSEPAVLTNDASAAGTQAIQNAQTVLKKAETDLWNAPELQGVRLRAEPFVNGVQNDVASMAPSFRMSIDRGPLAPLMADVHGLPEGASIADVNAIRSRVLEQARASRAAGDSVTASAAQQLADSLLTRTSDALGNAGSAVRDAYSTARDFTRQRAQALGYPEFDAILRPNAAGNMRANDETAFGRFFDLHGGTNAGLDRLQGVSSLLRSAGETQAADQLEGATRDYVRAGVLRQARAGNGLDAAGMPIINPATLTSTINRAMPAISGSPMTAPIAGDVQAAGNAAELLNRPSTLRGDTNSTTFEKLRNRDLVSAILGQAGSSSLGAAAGGYAGARYGPEEVPWYLRVPGGMLAGALMGQRMGPMIGRGVAHIPGVSGAITAPTQDIMRRVASGLASPAEYQRLLATHMLTGPDLTAPGALSAMVPRAAAAAIPMLTEGGAR